MRTRQWRLTAWLPFNDTLARAQTLLSFWCSFLLCTNED
jgi:hypothetical protein